MNLLENTLLHPAVTLSNKTTTTCLASTKKKCCKKFKKGKRCKNCPGLLKMA